MGCNEHIVMLPLMAHGHLKPFLALAKQIHRTTGYTITIASTPLNIHYLRSTISTNSTSWAGFNVRLAELPYCSTDHGLPPNTENTENLSFEQIFKHALSTTSLRTPFQNLLIDISEKDGKPPLCTIADIFFGWAVEVAKSVGAVNVAFTTAGAYGTLAYISSWLNLPHRKTDSEDFNLPGFPDSYRFLITQLHRGFRMADGTDPSSRFMQSQLSQTLDSYGMLCNTVEEVEPQAVAWLSRYAKLPVWTIGPLPPPAFLKNSSTLESNIYEKISGKVPGISPEMCTNFLDSCDPVSVLYISFGSQNTISPSQMMELARGLEESAKPFIWVIRPPIGFDIRGEFRAEWLPEGFEERITKGKKGLLVKNWAPQSEILSHKSTGAFLSHCGWNSVMESLIRGVPIIGWPMAGEQAFNSKLLVEEIGVSVELTRGVESSFEGKEVKDVIELVMGKNSKAEEMRKNAARIGKQIRASVMQEDEQKGSSVKALDEFVRSLLLRRQDQSVNPSGQ